MRRALRIDPEVSFFAPVRPWRTLAACLLAMMLVAALPATGHTQNFGLKNLQGKVYDASDAAISGAIVYLKNSRNNDVKTFLSEKDGTYRFAGLSADTDYTVWAAWHGQKSPTKTVSSFDTRKQVFIDLKVK
jgi:hypothetical protein